MEEEILEIATCCVKILRKYKEELHEFSSCEAQELFDWWSKLDENNLTMVKAFTEHSIIFLTRYIQRHKLESLAEISDKQKMHALNRIKEQKNSSGDYEKVIDFIESTMVLEDLDSKKNDIATKIIAYVDRWKNVFSASDIAWVLEIICGATITRLYRQNRNIKLRTLNSYLDQIEVWDLRLFFQIYHSICLAFPNLTKSYFNSFEIPVFINYEKRWRKSAIEISNGTGLAVGNKIRLKNIKLQVLPEEENLRFKYEVSGGELDLSDLITDVYFINGLDKSNDRKNKREWLYKNRKIEDIIFIDLKYNE